MTHHLEPVPDPADARSGSESWNAPWRDPDEEMAPRGRPPWWRWVAIAVVLAMVVATPFAYALYLLLR